MIVVTATNVEVSVYDVVAVAQLVMIAKGTFRP